MDAHALTARWVPGTLDKIRLTRRAAAGDANTVVALDRLIAVAGPDAIRTLYLEGRADLPGGERTWEALTGRA